MSKTTEQSRHAPTPDDIAAETTDLDALLDRVRDLRRPLIVTRGGLPAERLVPEDIAAADAGLEWDGDGPDGGRTAEAAAGLREAAGRARDPLARLLLTLPHEPGFQMPPRSGHGMRTSGADEGR